MRDRPTLTGVQRTMLAAQTLLSERHIYRIYGAEAAVSDRARERARRGAVALGLPLPPVPQPLPQRQAA